MGVGGDLTIDTLVKAYAEGVFPWYSEDDPILWWSPDPRAIIPIDGLHVSRSLARTVASGKFHVTFNTCFSTIMRACGENREGGTWVTDEMVDNYTRLHEAGYAHSVEVWQGDELAGGVYGVAIGAFFAGDSMFHRITDGSKVALVALVDRLRSRGFVLFDVQIKNDHTERMGAVEIPREVYLERLRVAAAIRGVSFADR